MKHVKILILAEFFRGERSKWIDDFCYRPDLQFEKPAFNARPISWHERGATTSLSRWMDHLNYVRTSLKTKPDCIVTCFPPLALIAAFLLLLYGDKRTPLIAWTFNLGSLPQGWKQLLSRLILKRVNSFVVHARSDVISYSKWAGICESKFEFIPLQAGNPDSFSDSPIEPPYIVSMGSAHRDYETLIKAVSGTGIKTVIISKKQTIDALPNDPDLIKLHGLSEEECKCILSGSSISVIPIDSETSSAGQVTFLTSLRMGIATIATRCTGSADYFENGATGFLVQVNDPMELRQTINALWQNDDLRKQIGYAGREHARENFSDEAIAPFLERLIDEVLENHGLTERARCRPD